MHPHIPMEMPYLPRETRHPHSGDAVIHHWRYIISFRDAHLPWEMPYLPQAMRHLHRKMWVHLQNLGYVTLLLILSFAMTHHITYFEMIYGFLLLFWNIHVVLVIFILILMKLLPIISHPKAMWETCTSWQDLLETNWCWVECVLFNFSSKFHTKPLAWLPKVSRHHILTFDILFVDQQTSSNSKHTCKFFCDREACRKTCCRCCRNSSSACSH